MTQPRAKARVLVFPCGSEVGLEVFRSLAGDTHIELHGASSTPSNHGKYLYRNYVDGLPHVTNPAFLDAMNALVRSRGIDYLFPAMDSVALALAETQDRLACQVIGSPLETCRVCHSKHATYERFAKIVRVPELYHDLADVPRWPIFLKPDCSYGSRGTRVAESPEEARFFLAREKDLLAMEYLPGKEYTIDCFTDRHGSLLFAGARQRLRIQNGICVHGRRADNDIFRVFADTINARLRFRGVWFFQLKESHDGEMVLLEIAPRVAGTMSLHRNLGVNLAKLSVYDAMGLDVSILMNEFPIEVDRALTNRFHVGLSYRHVYIDLDDCLICEGIINVEVIAFLYQCVNRGITLHLVTRHAGSVRQTLKQTRMENLFDAILHLQDGQRKSEVIRHADAIFIDDSFAERTDVHDRKGIPVFAPDAIECLMDWRRT
ncbi:MAG TPA: ATP-grasp domain-containing protein [Sedimentisphaerales bacterium]|nr:ATP-grasp domain-containing protein [Sedimentisphaerales bacterium]HQI28888.1 ATP-grasp domain-containing protein [Sedimentisphaerales bacterium]